MTELKLRNNRGERRDSDFDLCLPCLDDESEYLTIAVGPRGLE